MLPTLSLIYYIQTCLNMYSYKRGLFSCWVWVVSQSEKHCESATHRTVAWNGSSCLWNRLYNIAHDKRVKSIAILSWWTLSCTSLFTDVSVLPSLHASALGTTSADSHTLTPADRAAVILGTGTIRVWFNMWFNFRIR